MAWMQMALARLPPGMKDTPNNRLRVLTFVSCIGMVMNSDYVDYNHLRDLLTEMSNTVSQKDLQKWQIQSRFNLPKVFNMAIWKLHEDIPYRLVVPKTVAGSGGRNNSSRWSKYQRRTSRQWSPRMTCAHSRGLSP